MPGNKEHEDQIEKLKILERAVENTNEAFVSIDEKRTVLIFNKAAERIFGYSREEIIGQTLDLITAPGCSRAHQKAIGRYSKTGVPNRVGHKMEILATRKNGETFPATISLSVTNINGKLYFTGIVTDMTETHALQKKITESEHLAALGQLVAELTHEIKNPLALIGGFARQLIQSADEESRVKKASIIAEEVKRLEALLADLREYYLPRAINLQSLLGKVYSLIKDECADRKIKTALKIDKNAQVASGDLSKLEQVFLNLVKNSIEAMDNGGNLTISTRQLADEKVEISVDDDGCGIPKEHLDKVLECFFTTKTYGTGLGLCISKKFIDEHEGSCLNVESKLGHGTTFKIVLPSSVNS
jgi:PAS domain S-box-containing protein